MWHPLMCQRHKLPQRHIIHQRGAASPETYHRARLCKQEALALAMLPWGCLRATVLKFPLVMVPEHTLRVWQHMSGRDLNCQTVRAAEEGSTLMCLFDVELSHTIFPIRYNTDISALNISQYQNHSDIRMQATIHTFTTYFLEWSDRKGCIKCYWLNWDSIVNNRGITTGFVGVWTTVTNSKKNRKLIKK